MDTRKIGRMMTPAGRLMELLLPGGRLDLKAWHMKITDELSNGMFLVSEAMLQFYLSRRGSRWSCEAYRHENRYTSLRGESFGNTPEAAVRNFVLNHWEEIGWTP